MLKPICDDCGEVQKDFKNMYRLIDPDGLFVKKDIGIIFFCEECRNKRAKEWNAINVK